MCAREGSSIAITSLHPSSTDSLGVPDPCAGCRRPRDPRLIERSLDQISGGAIRNLICEFKSVLKDLDRAPRLSAKSITRFPAELPNRLAALRTAYKIAGVDPQGSK